MPAHLSEMAETVPRMLASIENQEEEKKKAETLVEETKTKRDELQKKIRDQEMTVQDNLDKFLNLKKEWDTITKQIQEWFTR